MNQDGHLHEEKIDSEIVFEGRLLQVRRDRVRLPNGAESTREFVVHPGAVTMLALLDMKEGKAAPKDPTFTGLDVCTPATAATCIAK